MRCIDKNRVTTRIISLTPGTLRLRFHPKFGHGFRVETNTPANFVDVPHHGYVDKRCEIHVLTSKNDWLSLVCSHPFPAVLLAPFICKLVMAARKVAERLRKLLIRLHWGSRLKLDSESRNK